MEHGASYHPVNPTLEVQRRTHPVVETPLICVSEDGSGGKNSHIRDCKGVKASRQIIHGAVGIAADGWIRRKIKHLRPRNDNNKSMRHKLRLFPRIESAIANHNRPPIKAQQAPPFSENCASSGQLKHGEVTASSQQYAAGHYLHFTTSHTSRSTDTRCICELSLPAHTFCTFG